MTGRKPSWSDDELAAAVDGAESYSEIMRRLGLHAVTNRCVRRRIEELGLVFNGFKPYRKKGSRSSYVYTEDALRNAVASSLSFSDVARHFERPPVGSTIAHVRRQISKFGIPTSHFQRFGRGRTSSQKKMAAEICVIHPSGSGRPNRPQLLRAMLELGVPYRCAGCLNAGIWQGVQLVLDIDHIDGNWLNNLIENLRFMCPNCHSQTPTWRARGLKHATSPVTSDGRGPD